MATTGPFLAPPAKRPFQSTTTMTDPNNFSNGSGPGYYSNKRSKPHPSANSSAAASSAPLPVPPGHVSFRLLSHESRIGGVIGKSGSIIKGLQQQTGAKIRIEDAPPQSQDRVITIIGPVAQSALSLNSTESAIEVSKGQEALVRVFERILEVAAQSDAVAAGGVVSCRLLAEVSSVGAVIGKGGKVVEKIRKDCGCKIKVLNDKLPACAGSKEEMIEIEGDVLAVKKGLVQVSRCLQDCQPVDKSRLTSSKSIEAVSQVSLPEVRLEILPQHMTLLPNIPSSTTSYASGINPLPLDSDRVLMLETKIPQHQVVFRILCSNDRVGGIIGKGGNIVKSLQNETGATINIGATASECDERLITITASENPESRYSAAQKTVVLVFIRFVESGIENGLDSASRGSPVTARLVVSPSQVGCLLGKGGTIISEMRRITSCGIRIVGGEQVPKCMPDTDHVVQISGDFVNVKDAIYHVTGRLRDNLFSSILSIPGARITSSVLTETVPYMRLRDPVRDQVRDLLTDPLHEPLRDPLRDPMRDPLRDSLREPVREPLREPMRDPLREPLRDLSRDPLRDSLREPVRDHASLSLQPTMVISHNLNRQTVLSQSVDHLGLQQSVDCLPSPRLWASQTLAGTNPHGIADVSRGLLPFRAGLEHCSGSKAAIVTNTTVEIIVPDNAFGSVYGENGGNLALLRQISGAKVIVHEHRLGTSERIVVISGTPVETQAAQSLLQAFIHTGQSCH